MAKDLHKKEFDEGTLAKLQIFEAYTQKWLPTFIMQKTPEIHIFDFFAGKGYDLNGSPGSPIRILKKLEELRGDLFNKGVKAVLYLNEYQQSKYEELIKNCQAFLDNHPGLQEKVEIRYHNKDFEALYQDLFKEIRDYPSLIFLDQNGVKFLNRKYLADFENSKQTDFLFFVSSSHFWRFGELEEFKPYLDFDLDDVKTKGYKFIHKNLTNKLKENLATNTKLKLYSFSLKKGSNIHGIIFGATHPRAFDKFLEVAWKTNKINGIANFDIYEDLQKGQMDLFEGKKLTKKESFKEEVRQKVLSEGIQDNKALLEFCYEKGHIPRHAKECLEKMKKDKEVYFEGSTPKVNYDKVFKEKRLVKFQVLKNK